MCGAVFCCLVYIIIYIAYWLGVCCAAVMYLCHELATCLVDINALKLYRLFNDLIKMAGNTEIHNKFLHYGAKRCPHTRLTS